MVFLGLSLFGVCRGGIVLFQKPLPLAFSENIEAYSSGPSLYARSNCLTLPLHPNQFADFHGTFTRSNTRWACSKNVVACQLNPLFNLRSNRLTLPSDLNRLAARFQIPANFCCQNRLKLIQRPAPNAVQSPIEKPFEDLIKGRAVPRN